MVLEYLPEKEIREVVEKACNFADSQPTVQRCMAARMISYLANV